MAGTSIGGAQRGGMRLASTGLIWASGFCMVVALAAISLAQNTGTTIRRHKVEVRDPMFPPELLQAEDDIQKQDYSRAEPLLEKVVAQNPANYQAWFDLGFVANALGKPEQSIAAYRKSVAAKPEVFESNLNLGLMLAKAGQPDAEQYLRAATTLPPSAQPDEGHARAWLGLAHVLETGKPDEAIAAYRQAAALRPRDPEPHLAAGLLLQQSNHFADAAEEYRRALALDPKSSDAVIALANLYMRGNQFDEAEIMLRKVIAERPQDAAAHMQLGRVLAADGKNEEAIPELEAGLKGAPNDTAAARDLADINLAAGKYPQAEAGYRALLGGDPKNPDLHWSLGKAFMKQRKFSDAQQEFVAAVQLKPDFGAAYGDLAAAANENQNYELTIRALDARAKFLPDIPMTYFTRAISYDHLRDYKDAALNYHKFLEVSKGQFPDHEWQARHRLIAIEPKR
jgi:tetratricopeptide (TPR) repeat protein